MSEAVIPTEVNGVAVITAERVVSPLSTIERPVFFANARELLLADGTTMFSCSYCGHVADRHGRIRSHQGYDCQANPRNIGRRDVEMRGVVPAASNPSRREVKVTRKKKEAKVVKRIEPGVGLAVNDEGDDVLAALEMVLNSESRTQELTDQRDRALAERDDWRQKFLTANATLEKVRARLRDSL